MGFLRRLSAAGSAAARMTRFRVVAEQMRAEEPELFAQLVSGAQNGMKSVNVRELAHDDPVGFVALYLAAEAEDGRSWGPPKERARALDGAEARQREAEEFMLSTLRAAEESYGVPVALLDAYADAIDRYDLGAWRPGEDRHTAAETMEEARARHRQLIEAMAEYTLNGGRSRGEAFSNAVDRYVAFAVVAVEVAQEALHTSGVGFSEFTDPAFASLVERDEQ